MSDRTVLGIDLGTTYSCVARLDDYGRPEVLPNLDGAQTTPSVVYFEDGGNVVVGEGAKNEFSRNPERVVSLFKRHMGEDDFDFEIDGERYLPQKVSAMLLRYLVTSALGALSIDVPQEGPLADVVITVPAYFGAGERQATRDAGTMAGLNVLNIINEPTAAAIAYGLASEGEGERRVLVYDLGGGTFDVTVITVAAEQIRVIATDGDHQLGGADWDNQLADLLAEKFIAEHPDAGDPRLDEAAAGDLTLLAEQAKKSLSSKEKYRTAVTAHGRRASVEITRDEYEERTAALIERTIEFTANLIKVANGKGIDRFDAVLLVGGMSRSLAVARGLTERFPDLPTPRLTDPDHIVAKGAVLFAANSRYDVDPDSGGSQPSKTDREGDFLPGPTIINVSSKGYGVRVVDGPRDPVGHVEWLVRPNDEIPAVPTRTFHTVSDNQEVVQIEVYESLTAELARELESNKKLIAGDLKGLPPRKPAGQPVDVDFALGDDGILRITARSGGRVLNLTAEISGATPQAEMDKPLPVIQY